jgi:isopenicillin N synthase-like dioxygenase
LWNGFDPDANGGVLLELTHQNGSSQGVGPHKDYGFLALILQDDHGGLEVDDARGGMIDVTPIPGTLVANLGEMFEVASGGYFRATIHRARSPEASDDRVSIAHFFSPKLEAVLGKVPLPPHLADKVPAPVIDPQNPIYAEFGRNALRGWVRSHPVVARRHYPELARLRNAQGG